MGNGDGAEGIAAWAAAHGLTVEDGVHLPRTTPLLAEGEVHSVDALAGGWLSKYVEAKLALIDRDGGHFTVAVTHVPKAKRFVPWMLCHRVEDEHLLGRAALGLIGNGNQVGLEGTLCVSLLGQRTVAEDLDGLRDATVELVRRIRAEISERLGPAQSARAAPGATGFDQDSAGTAPQG